MNCSAPDDYYVAIDRLQNELRKREYPATERIPYDEAKRARMLQALRARTKQAQQKRCCNNIVVFKTAYSPQLQGLGIKAAYGRLLRTIRHHLGDSAFLQNERFVIAYPSSSTLFKQYYSFNFPKQ